MNPYNFLFKESAKTTSVIDYSSLKYSEELNLNIDCNTNEVAIKYLDMETITMTKSDNEVSDSDYDLNSSLRLMLETMTGSLNDVESTDSDQDRNSIQQLLATETFTERIEETDQDKR